MMVGDCYAELKNKLEKAGCDSPAFDAMCLLEDLGGVPHGRLSGWLDCGLAPEQLVRLREAGEQRAAGRPLQYILGEWGFLSLTLAVGEGVLIPRPDTELLCEAAAEWLKGMEGSAPARVLDLCAGSGCVGLGLASLFPGVEVTAVELLETALDYLNKNIARYPEYQVRAVRADVLRDGGQFSGDYQAILSNPPYIPREELPGLMREVQHEPLMALDGGTGDGLLFYRAIARDWLGKLLPGGFCAVEVGIGQAETVAALWEESGLCDVEIRPDLGGVPRVVIGRTRR